MNQYLLTAFRLRRMAIAIIGVATLVAVLFPAATYAAPQADGVPAESVTQDYGKGYGKDYDKGYGKDYGKGHKQPKYHAPKPSHRACPHIYIVQKGDTLSALARHYNTTVHALAKANGIRNPNKITVGQRLCVPHKQAYVPPKPKPKEIHCKAYHTVKHKDTLVRIAKRHHTTVQQIIDANKLRGPHYIYSGQKLCIR